MTVQKYNVNNKKGCYSYVIKLLMWLFKHRFYKIALDFSTDSVYCKL